jgi:hypothetical protein
VKRAASGCGLALALTVFGIACNGGDGGPTHAEFVRQANRVCGNAAAKISTLRIPGRADVSSMPQAAAGVVAVQREYLERLRAIKAPKEDRTEIAKWIALVDQTIDQAEVSAESQLDGDISRAVTANLNGAALDRRADDLAEAYGMDVCIQSTTPPPTTSTTRSGT